MKFVDGDTLHLLAGNKDRNKIRLSSIDTPERGQAFGRKSKEHVAMVRAGLAWWYRKYAHEQSMEDQRAYERAEDEALTEQIGLWRDPHPTPQWESRRR